MFVWVSVSASRDQASPENLGQWRISKIVNEGGGGRGQEGARSGGRHRCRGRFLLTFFGSWHFLGTLSMIFFRWPFLGHSSQKLVSFSIRGGGRGRRAPSAPKGRHVPMSPPQIHPWSFQESFYSYFFFLNFIKLPMNGQSLGIESIPVLRKFWNRRAEFWKFCSALVQTCIPINLIELIDMNWFIFSVKLIESIQFLFQASWLVIELIRFHGVGDKKVNEIEGFPKKVNIYIELIDFWFRPPNHFEKSTPVSADIVSLCLFSHYTSI